MAGPAETSGAGRRFVINIVGVIGLVFGALAVLRYLLDSDILAFSDAPYRWLALEGGARFIPPVMVLVVCIAVAYWLERGSDDD
ncbi:hypothetical protein [Humibacillus sp. DSM 29435]|uniref:hypothetical protein n=1 Tax=Humibacillus sp. DSM 29435 TaxID=1869167 RepID=UPI0009F19595|nr:hypothetical protein [Humibacillus sp. DSM 29435]